MKSGSLNLLEPSRPHQACYGTALPGMSIAKSLSLSDWELNMKITLMLRWQNSFRLLLTFNQNKRGTKFIKHETVNTLSLLLQCHVIIYAKTNTQYIKNNIKQTFTCLEFTILHMNTICNLDMPLPLSKGLSCIFLKKIQQ